MMNCCFRLARALIILGAIGISANLASAETAGGYQFKKEIPIGGDGGWDYLSVDGAARRLYVTHGTKVVVIDIDKDQVVGEIADTPGVHGFAIAHDLGRGFASNGREGKVSIVDLKTLKTISKVDAGENPDAILYEPGHQEVYAFNGRSSTVTVIGAVSGTVTATIPLPGKPEFAQCDPKAGRVYCNLEDESQIAAIDTKTHTVVNTWPIAPGEEASGLAIDVTHHRLFAGCHNKLMVMVDSGSGNVIASVPIGDRVDANAYDPGTGFAFSSNGDGTLTVAHEETPDKLTVVQTVVTERGARTMALDPKTHNVYLASAKFEAPAVSGTSAASATPMASGTSGASPAPGAGYPGGERPRQRPRMVPGTFKILVYAIGQD